jgi:uncharacterized protein DUF11
VLSRRLRTYGAALLTALIGACVIAAPAGAATKPYSVVVSPTSVPAGASVPFQATITNRSPNQTLGSANVTVPATFTITDVAVSAGTVSRSGNTVQLRNLGIAFGKSVTATITATVPSSTPCAPASFAWQVAAKQSNDFNGTGNDFGPLTSDSALTTSTACDGTVTTCAAPCLGTLSDPDASISVSIPGSAGVVTITRGAGLDCAGYNEILAQDFGVEFVPNPGTVGGTKIVTINISKAAMQASTNNGLSQVNVCFGAPFVFAVKPGTPPLQPGPGGINIGLLPDCGVPPCVASRQSVGGGARIVVNAPGGNQDPRYGP